MDQPPHFIVCLKLTYLLMEYDGIELQYFILSSAVQCSAVHWKYFLFLLSNANVVHGE